MNLNRKRGLADEAVIDQLTKNPDMMRQGDRLFLVFIIALIAGRSAYFSPIIKQYLVTKIKVRPHSEQVQKFAASSNNGPSNSSPAELTCLRKQR